LGKLTGNITKRKLTKILAEQWGGMSPITFQNDGLGPSFQYDVDTSYLTFTCCGHDHRITLPPNEIIELYGKSHSGIVCPICYQEGVDNGTIKIDEKTVKTSDPADEPLPGEEVVTLPWKKEGDETETVEEVVTPEISTESVTEEKEAPKPTIKEILEIGNEKLTVEEKEIVKEIKETAEIVEEVIEEQEKAIENVEYPVEEDNEAKEKAWEMAVAEKTEKLENIQEELRKIFGYFVYDENIGIEIDEDDLDKYTLSVKCKICGKDLVFNDINELTKTIELGNESHTLYHNCKHCLISIGKSVDKEGSHIWRNELFARRVNDALKEKGGHLILTKGGSKFLSPQEEIKYEDSNGNKKNTYIFNLLNEFTDDFMNFIPPKVEKKPEVKEKIKLPPKMEKKAVKPVEEPKIIEEEPPIPIVEVKDEEIVVNDDNIIIDNDEMIVVDQTKPDTPFTDQDDEEDDGPIILDLGWGNRNIQDNGQKQEEIVENEPETVKDEEITENDDGIIRIDLGLGKSGPGNDEKSSTTATPSNSSHYQDDLRSYIDEEKQEKRKWYENRVFFDASASNTNEFFDEESLFDIFAQSKTGELIETVRSRTQTDVRIRIDEDTIEIPIVDFSTGVRVICLDVDNESQLKIPLQIEQQVPFQFPIERANGRNYSKVYLYSDSVNNGKQKFNATMKNLVKLVNRDYYDPQRMVTLDKNYALFYTDTKHQIKEFENLNSSYCMGKPMTHQIAIIAMRNTVEKHRKFTAKDVLQYINNNGNSFEMKNYNMYVVGSARFIELMDSNRVAIQYLITDYTELSASIILDGFDHIIGAILKEHQLRHPNLNCEIHFEFDPSLIMSPSLERLYDNKDIMEIGTIGDTNYIRRPQYRFSAADSFRQDERLFTITSLSKRFPTEIAQSGFDITNGQQRAKFIEQLGFVKVYQPKIKKFMVNPIFQYKTQFRSSVLMMQKLDLDRFFSGSGIYQGGYDSVLYQKMMVNMMNQNKNGNGGDNPNDILQMMLMMNMLNNK
jgi:hypothetical protein